MPLRAVEPVNRATRDPLPKLLVLGQKLVDMPAPKLRAYLEGATPDRRRIAEYALGTANAHWRANPATFLEHLDPNYERHRVADLLGAAFRRAWYGIEPRQIWELPARLGKSRLASQGGPSWGLDLDPTATVILVSYAQNLAMENALAVRDMFRVHPGELRVRLRLDRQRGDRFKTTMGGGLLAAGMEGTVAGFGAGGGLLGSGGGVILDDPLKNWAEAHSALKRENAWKFFLSVLRLRLDWDGAFIIIVTTRWHKDDPVGRALGAMKSGDGDDWVRYRLPAIAETPSVEFPEPDLLGRAPGEVLVPSRFPLEQVKARHKALGPYLTAALEQQRPAPEEGGELKREWWRFGTPPTTPADDALTSWDMKMKDVSASGDFVVGQAWKRYGSTMWGVDQIRGQFNFVTTMVAIALMQIRHPEITRHVIENTGNGPEVIKALRRGFDITIDDVIAAEITRGGLALNRDERAQVEALMARGMSGIVSNDVSTQGDKVVRARLASPYLQAGDVWIDENAVNGWGLSLVNEAAAFPDPSGHDDQVDAWSQGARYLLALDIGDTEIPLPGKLARPPSTHVGPPRGHIGGERPR